MDGNNSRVMALEFNYSTLNLEVGHSEGQRCSATFISDKYEDEVLVMDATQTLHVRLSPYKYFFPEVILRVDSS